MTLRPSPERKSRSPEEAYQNSARFAETLQIQVTCPCCGVAREGTADEILVWRTAHQCRRPGRAN